MKQCTKCGEKREFHEFSNNKTNRDGLECRCKSCRRDYYIQNKERANYLSKKYGQENRESILEAGRLYYENNKDKINERGRRHSRTPEGIRANLKYRAKFPRQHRARCLVMYAMTTGAMVRPSTCSECSKSCTPDAHHDDYCLPLEVRFLCKKCHSKFHHNNTPLNKG